MFLKSALMASPCPSTLAKEILANNPDLIIRETLYSADQERSNCRTLGPCFRGVASGVLEVFITLRQGQEFFLLDEPRIHWADWSGQKKPLKNWPDGWTSWLNRVERAKADHWKRVGIFEALQLSRYDIHCDKSLLSAALFFWSISTNSFHFKCGMMGPTILDVAALTGFRPYGEVVSAVTMGPAKTEDGQTLDCSFKGWAKFMSHYHKKKGPVTDKEHLAFLLVE